MSDGWEQSWRKRRSRTKTKGTKVRNRHSGSETVVRFTLMIVLEDGPCSQKPVEDVLRLSFHHFVNGQLLWSELQLGEVDDLTRQGDQRFPIQQLSLAFSTRRQKSERDELTLSFFLRSKQAAKIVCNLVEARVAGERNQIMQVEDSNLETDDFSFPLSRRLR